ncbi:hypothetical protein H696_02372 [Fonticula alba]|uniref:COX assembly mitochondrial protein n=1 Tax=Fonticula alba TaxID=691883 RepID=A0A058ZAI7_FONAL|nr:hypothetical protein H696_02372 [Fonticula alba]KCV71424.1 hypothetical protein H696_02372 [Fonticula alba]|eukprot:XP_009494547.1 hypothetical protein H696_02372 [Fonticula alba]
MTTPPRVDPSSFPPITLSNLSKSDENHVHDAFRSEVRQKCDAQILKYIDCAYYRTLSIPSACREVADEMNACLRQFMTREQADQFRATFIASKGAEST